jgi:hypothetical protein
VHFIRLPGYADHEKQDKDVQKASALMSHVGDAEWEKIEEDDPVRQFKALQIKTNCDV